MVLLVIFFDLIVIVFNLVQPLNALAPILVILLGSVILVSALQLSNAPAPMVVTLLPTVAVSNFVQPLLYNTVKHTKGVERNEKYRRIECPSQTTYYPQG